jgi:hypothetical protein
MVMSAADADMHVLASFLGPKPRDAPYVPSTLPGARLPHFTLCMLCPGGLEGAAVGQQDSAGAITSSIDLAAAGGLGLVLLLGGTGAAGSLDAWMSAVNAVHAALGVRVTPVVVASSRAEGEGLLAGGLHPSVCVVFAEGGTWERLRGVGPSGAVLVRPDGHVAWRVSSIGAKERAATDTLMHVVKQCLKRL